MNTEHAVDDVRQGEEMEFAVFGRKLAAKRWGRPGGRKTLALHGWLDNANTFDRLAPLLPELDLVALDFAGHGRSDHRPPGVHYHSFTNIQDVLAVAQELGWEQCIVMGHSMGAGIASELAALFPEKVEQAIMLDGFLATGGVTAKERLEQNRTSIENMLDTNHREPKIFADLEAMAQRVTQATDQTMDAARVLVERGHKRVEGGVTWRTDPRIRYPTPLRHTRATIDLLIENSTSPALLIVAEQGDDWYQGEIDVTAAHHPNLSIERMPGPHHIHLEPAYVEQVAGYVRRFLGLQGDVKAA